MSIHITPKEKQGYGAFNDGEIIENKPIGFPKDHSAIRPYSNLFYWAHARAVTDSTIGLHPHQGFEICSFVLKGKIRHYDTKLKTWRDLEAGDVQIIRAGNGISHSEWMGKDAEMFQIWFDPNLNKTMQQAASYDDYRDAEFPEKTGEGYRIKTLVGDESPFRMDTPGIEVQQIELNASRFERAAQKENIYSIYVLEGSLRIQDNIAHTSDFVQVTETDTLVFEASEHARIFVIASPVQPGYQTYSQLRRV
jgi:redox-sensitive bicupin YhaK (pirin superfamily)